MKINNVDISNFGAELISYEVQDSDLDYSSEWAPRSLTPLVSLDPPKYKKLVIQIFIEATNRLQLEKNKSLLQSAMRKGIVKFEDSAMLYEGVLDGVKFDKWANLATKATVTFMCLAFEDETTINLNKTYTQSVNIKGNSQVEVIYTVTTQTPLAQLKINDITIKNVEAGKTLVIDGVAKKVTVDGVNKFKDADFIKFPTLNAGNNTITIDALTPTITIKYKPRWS